jgi:hypothetical protein
MLRGVRSQAYPGLMKSWGRRERPFLPIPVWSEASLSQPRMGRNRIGWRRKPQEQEKQYCHSPRMGATSGSGYEPSITRDRVSAWNGQPFAVMSPPFGGSNRRNEKHRVFRQRMPGVHTPGFMMPPHPRLGNDGDSKILARPGGATLIRRYRPIGASLPRYPLSLSPQRIPKSRTRLSTTLIHIVLSRPPDFGSMWTIQVLRASDPSIRRVHATNSSQRVSVKSALAFAAATRMAAGDPGDLTKPEGESSLTNGGSPTGPAEVDGVAGG